MSSTWRGSISIEIPEEGAPGAGERKARWARVELDDFFWIGRCSICNLRIQGDTQVSRLQATIHRDGAGYLLTDMQSRNGTAVNGRRIHAVRLVPGDRVKVGQTLFEFEPDGKQDTVFRQGTSRVVGSADVELKSFPCSLQSDHVDAGGGFVMNEVPPTAAREPRGPKPIAPMPNALHAGSHARSQNEPPDGSPMRPLVEFVTIVVDRLVCELQAALGMLHVPPVGGHDALTVARGMVDGKLEVLFTPGEAVRRVAMHLTPLSVGESVPEEGERIIWRGAEPVRRLVPLDRTLKRLESGAGFTIALPRVGRLGMHEPLPQPTRGMAWIHVEDVHVPRNMARLVEEVAAAVSASVIRFLERGSD